MRLAFLTLLLAAGCSGLVQPGRTDDPEQPEVMPPPNTNDGGREIPTETPTEMPPVPDAVRGQQLFVSAGCNGCHADIAGNERNIHQGAEPEAIAAAIATEPMMARYAELTELEIADLALYIAGEIDSIATEVAAGLIPDPQLCESIERSTSGALIRRLTPAELAFAVADLFALDLRERFVQTLPVDSKRDLFLNSASVQGVTGEHITAYETLAAEVVGELDIGALVDAYADCTEMEARCYDTFIEGLGLRMYRQPVIHPNGDDDDLVALRGLFAASEAEGDGFSKGAELVVQAMLQSPRFLYRREVADGQNAQGGRRQLNDFELANRLSFLVWASIPDRTLLDAAARGELQTTAQIEEQLNRMLQDTSKRRRATRQFLADWLDIESIVDGGREGLNPATAEALLDEAVAFGEAVLWSESGLTELLTRSFNPGSGTTEFYRGGDRVGLLGQGAVLAVAGNRQASLVERGKYIYNRLTCNIIPPPPAGLDTTPLAIAPGSSERDHSEARLQDDNCGFCHEKVDPMGWAFEQYDALGRWRTEDEEGNPLSNSGYYEDPDLGRVEYTSQVEFVNRLATSPTTQDCLISRVVQYVEGRDLLGAVGDEKERSLCSLSDIKVTLGTDTPSYEDIIRAIARSESFRFVHAD